MPIHVFYDNSNVWGGAHSVRIKLEPEIPWVALRIGSANIFKLIEQGRTAKTKILAGSVPPSCEELWEFARNNRYQTDLLKRVEKDDGSVGEQGVDEILHLKIANALIDYPSTDILVVVTGDGSVSEFGTGFIPKNERAIKLGWRVEVWSWSATCSRKFLALSKKFSSQLKLISLDPFYLGVTFVKAGNYYRMVGGIRENFDLNGRNMQKL